MRRAYRLLGAIAILFFALSGLGRILDPMTPTQGTGWLIVKYFIVRSFKEGFLLGGCFFGLMAFFNFLGSRFTINIKNELLPTYLIMGMAGFATLGIVGLLITGADHPASLLIIILTSIGALLCLAAACFIRGVMRDDTYDGLDRPY